VRPASAAGLLGCLLLAAGHASGEPVLRATLVAGEASLADLGGVVLAVGEQTHGYRLVEVREFEAVFERGGENLVLGVQPVASVAP
jgi:hypothetical protein